MTNKELARQMVKRMTDPPMECRFIKKETKGAFFSYKVIADEIEDFLEELGMMGLHKFGLEEIDEMAEAIAKETQSDIDSFYGVHE